MLVKSGLFLFLLTVLQVSARYKSVEPDFIENEIIPESLLSSSTRIVSGWLAERGQFPYHVSLRFAASNGNMRQCGGAIISNEWIVTSAFCTVNRIRVTVHAGGVISSESEYIAMTTLWYNHPLFQASRPELQSNDISLVKLQVPVVYTRFLQPIRIQSSADAFRNYDGQKVVATGNGSTENSGSLSVVLRWVYLRAISNNECSRLYSNGVIDTTICAQYFNVTSQANCFGDNGGPLVHVDSDGVPTLIGVSLYYSTGCNRNLPSGFIRPGPFLPWFQEVTGINFDQEVTTTTSTSSTTTTTTPTTSIAPTTTTIPITTTTSITTTTTTAPTTPATPTSTTTPTTTTTTTTPTTPIAPTTTTIPITTTTPTITTTTTAPTTPATPTTPEITTASITTTVPYTQTTPTTTSTPTTTTTDSGKPDDPDDLTTEENITAPTEDSEEQEPDGVAPEDNTVAPPEDSEEKEEDNEDDSDCSESNENDEIGQLIKRLQVDVKVKVRFDKYNLTNAVGNEIVAKH